MKPKRAYIKTNKLTISKLIEMLSIDWVSLLVKTFPTSQRIARFGNNRDRAAKYVARKALERLYELVVEDIILYNTEYVMGNNQRNVTLLIVAYPRNRRHMYSKYKVQLYLSYMLQSIPLLKKTRCTYKMLFSKEKFKIFQNEYINGHRYEPVKNPNQYGP